MKAIKNYQGFSETSVNLKESEERMVIFLTTSNPIPLIACYIYNLHLRVLGKCMASTKHVTIYPDILTERSEQV